MASTIQSLVDMVRNHLVETTASFWTDAELVAIMNKGAKDLFRAINDNGQDYFFARTTVADNVRASASTEALAGVPTTVTIIKGIEPLSQATYPNLKFFPRSFQTPEFQTARAQSAIEPRSGGNVYYAITGAGAPIGAPTIYIAPTLSTEVALMLIHIPELADFVIGGSNPIPGFSDQALVNWTMAYAKAKEREDGMPDPGWLSLYGNEKNNILVSLAPRQTDEVEVAEAIFEELW
jgi:hypothetical protein